MKKNQLKLNKLLRKKLVELGGKPIHPQGYPDKHLWYSFQTIYGELLVKPEMDIHALAHSTTLACCSRFTDASKLPKTGNGFFAAAMNTLNGKWNWCVWQKDWTPEDLASRIIEDIGWVLPENNPIPESP